MTVFDPIDGSLHAEGVALDRLAQEVGTPCYVYSRAGLESAFSAFSGALAGLDALVCFAVKANSNLAVIKTFAALGAGADVVSVGELERALAAGIPADRVVFAGVGKRREEMVRALEVGILQFNVESLPELLALDEVARSLGKRAEIAIRVNPDVDALTHEKISTGRKENKFGIDIDQALSIYAQARDLAEITAVAVSVHIGSQLTDLAPIAVAFGRVRTLVQALREAGHDIHRIDLGGGLGITYRDETPIDPLAYAEVVRQTVGDLGCRLVFEPGRYLVGNAGILLSRVLYVKRGDLKDFLIIDAAMNDLVRPAMYDAWHDIEAVASPRPDVELVAVDVVGPICESSDLFAKDRLLPPLKPGDLVAIRSAGAYGAAMASTYNSRALAPEIMVDGTRYAVIRPRIDPAQFMEWDAIPPWL